MAGRRSKPSSAQRGPSAGQSAGSPSGRGAGNPGEKAEPAPDTLFPGPSAQPEASEAGALAGPEVVADASNRPRALLWLAAERAELMADVLRRADVRVVALGLDVPRAPSSVRSSEADPRAQTARPLEAIFPGAASVTDLRAAFAEGAIGFTQCDALVIAGGASLASSAAEVRAIAAAAGRGLPVISLDPLTTSTIDIAGSIWAPSPWIGHAPGGEMLGAGIGAVSGDTSQPTARAVGPVLGPLLRHDPEWPALIDAIEHAGTVRALQMTLLCRPHHTSLGALLLAAADAAITILGDFETVHAAQPMAASLGDAASGLARLAGSACVLARSVAGVPASIALSDRAGHWARQVTLVGTECDIHARLDGRSASERASARCRPFETEQRPGVQLMPQDRPDAADESAVDALAQFVGACLAGRALEPLAPGRPIEPIPLPHLARCIAFASAAMLSLRTGQPESPMGVEH